MVFYSIPGNLKDRSDNSTWRRVIIKIDIRHRDVHILDRGAINHITAAIVAKLYAYSAVGRSIRTITRNITRIDSNVLSFFYANTVLDRVLGASGTAQTRNT